MKGLWINRATRCGVFLLILFFYLLFWTKHSIAGIACGTIAFYLLGSTGLGHTTGRKYEDIKDRNLDYLIRKSEDRRIPFCDREAYRYAAERKKKNPD